MADARLLEMLLNPLSIHRLTPSNSPLRHVSVKKPKATIFCSNSETGKPDQSISGGTSKSVTRSSRGRTRQSLGFNEGNSSSLEPAHESLISEPLILNEREGDANSSISAKSEFDAATLLQNIKSKSYGQGQVSASNLPESEAKSLMDWAQRNKPPAKSSEPGKTLEPPIPDMANRKEISKRIQDLINADLDRKYKSDDEDSDDDQDPLFVDEDDPYWLDEPDEGWGYKVSDLFKEDFGVKDRKKKKVDDDHDDVSDIPDIDWDFEPEKWSAKDVDSMNWTDTVFGDPSPLVALVYDRYGKQGRECYHVLRELEDAANRIWECKRLPPRLVKINMSFEEDLTAALRVKEVPTLLFIKAGKLIHQQSGYFTADNLLRMISYFYHGAARPPCLKKFVPDENASMKL